MTWRELYTVVEFCNGDVTMFTNMLKFLAEREAKEEAEKAKFEDEAIDDAGGTLGQG